jgi:hypothetical protein
MSGVQVTGELKLSERTVLGVLDQEAQRSVREATRMRATAINAAAPVGRTSGRTRPANPSGTPLSRSHKPSVRKTPFGYRGSVRRAADAWYGGVVERGRKAGRSSRSRRAYPAARANPFVDRVDAGISDEAEQLLAAGAERAASQIEARL